MNKTVAKLIDETLLASKLNRLPIEYDAKRIFEAPLIGVAAGDDPIFLKFKDVVSKNHLTPIDIWSNAGFNNEREPIFPLRVISIVFPFSNEIRKTSRNATKIPSESYCLARNLSNSLIDSVCLQLVKWLKGQGFRAIIGAKSQKYDMIGFYSNWSERHVAFAAGLGSFGLSEGFITKVGVNIRICSLITDAHLEITRRKSNHPYWNCLYYKTGECAACADKCPAGAITKKGHNKKKCWKYGKKIAKQMNKKIGEDLQNFEYKKRGKLLNKKPVGCALCQFNVPCMSKSPTT